MPRPSGVFPASLSRRALLTLTGAMSLPALARTGPRIKVASVFSLPFHHLLITRIHQPLLAANERGDIEYLGFETVAHSDYLSLLRRLVKRGVQLIVGESTWSEEAVRTVAREAPEVAFLWWSQGEPQAPNLSIFDNCIPQPLYLAGMLAASLSPRHHLGMVGGQNLRDTRIMMNAFIAGAREVDPQIRWDAGVINHWYNPVRARKMTKAMLNRGADVLMAFSHAGVVETAVEHGVPAFNCMANQQEQYPNTVVAAALWHPDPVIHAVIKSVQGGRLMARNYSEYTSMVHQGSSLTTLGRFETRISAALRERVAQRMTEMRQGRFNVPRNTQLKMTMRL